MSSDKQTNTAQSNEWKFTQPLTSVETVVYGPRLKIVTLGDSITQRGGEIDGWVTKLGQHYTRKADVLNRGYSGYNSVQGLKLVQSHLKLGVWPYNPSHSLSLPSRPSTPNCPHTPANVLVTVFFGANDAALLDSHAGMQHVTIPNYIANLKSLCYQLKPSLIPLSDGSVNPLLARDPVHIVLITPPQVDGIAWGTFQATKFRWEQPKISRTNEQTKQYAEAVIEVGKQLKIPVVDLYAVSGESRNFCDGLHLSERGNQLLFSELMKTIEKHWSYLLPQFLPWDGPLWDKERDDDFP